MAITIPRLTNGDVLKTDVNLALSKVESILRSIPGASLVAGSVALSKLAQTRALAPYCDLLIDDLDGLANGTILDGWEAPTVDGGSSANFKLTSYTMFGRDIASPTGNGIEVYKNAVTTGNVISLTGLTSGVPDSGVFASAINYSSGDKITLVFVKSGGPTLNFMRFRIWGTEPLVTTG